MKATDYRIPWGRPSEDLLAVKRELAGQQLHVRRVQDARNRSTIDTDPPDCAHMPHLISRPKKKKMQEDRQREIATENFSLMQRLASIMKEERGNPVRKFSHLSVEYRESLRRKKLLQLETENRRLARSIRKQKPFYPNRAMEKEEDNRQALLRTMSRTERRKERVALFRASTTSGRGSSTNNKSSHYLNDGTTVDQQRSTATLATASLVEDGVLFRPGQTAVPLRTARQMQLEVARRRRGGGSGISDESGGGGSQGYFSPGSGDEHESGRREGRRAGNDHGGETQRRLSSSLSTVAEADSLTVRRRGYDNSDGSTTATAAAERGAVVLEVNRTGGGGGSSGGGLRRGGGGGRIGGVRRWRASGEGRPNMIFTPSLVPVGMESVHARPLTLGPPGSESLAQRERQTTECVRGDTCGLDEGEGVLEALRDTRTV